MDKEKLKKELNEYKKKFEDLEKIHDMNSSDDSLDVSRMFFYNYKIKEIENKLLKLKKI